MRTVWAVWTSQYLIYDANDGSEEQIYQPFDEVDGVGHVPPELRTDVFSRTGYTLGGWNTAAGGNGISYNRDNPLPDDFQSGQTLYAQWKPNQYGITSKSSGNGTLTVVSSAKYDEEVTIITKPAEGYVLDYVTVTDSNSKPVTVEGNGDAYTFTMPAGDVTVSATFKLKDYRITCDTVDNGTVTADKETAHMDDTVTITTAPHEGYVLDHVTVTDSNNKNVTVGGEGTTHTFIMPASDVTVSASFIKQEPDVYGIHIADSEHGTVTSEHENAHEDMTIALTVTPEQGYELDALTVTKDKDGAEVEVVSEGGIYTFTMPADDVIVTAVFEETSGAAPESKPEPEPTPSPYSISLDTVVYGSVRLSADEAFEDDEVFITATANSGYTLKSLTVKRMDTGAQVSTERSGNVYTFTMPGSHVTVSVVFEKVYTPPRDNDDDDDREYIDLRPSAEPQPPGGWPQDEIRNADPGTIIHIDMTGIDALPGHVLDLIAGKDITLELEMGPGIIWEINGNDIPDDLDSLNLGISMGGDIPINVINTITGETHTLQFELSHNGEFGATIHLTMEMGSNNRGYWANLYWYREEGKLEFQSSSRISAEGKASWPFDHASTYLVVIDGERHSEWTNHFADVSESDWFYPAVEFANNNGLMSGISADLFDPHTAATRGQLVAILYHMDGAVPAEQKPAFTDVAPEMYYAEAVSWAAQNGIVSGSGNGLFGPNDPITREQLSVILWNYAKYRGYDVSVGENTNILSCTDVLEISEYAVSAMRWACGTGVLGGYEDGTLRPCGKAERAHTAQMLRNFMKSIEAIDDNMIPGL